MSKLKILIRIFVWVFVISCICVACFFYFLGDINKLKSPVENYLKNELNCTVRLGELDWDWDGLKLGVTTTEISLFDKENNIVLQGGPTRFVWHLKNIITGVYSHFYRIDSTDLYLNAIRYKNGKWNLVELFPIGPPPKVDNVDLHNSIVYLVDEFNPTSKSTLYKDLNLTFEKGLFSKVRRINLVTRIGSVTGPSFLKIKGKYTEKAKFDWNKSQYDLFVVAKEVNLANLHGYISDLIKEPKINKINGDFTGIISLKKNKNEKVLKLRAKSKTNNFLVEIENKDIAQLIEIPRTNFTLRALIDERKIKLQSFKSTIDELTYNFNGYIFNWSKTLPEADLELKTNKFNFKAIKPYLPISLLPADTRARIEPINDDGLVKLDLKLKGPIVTPKYFGKINLEDFNLTAESGFLNVIRGLNGELLLNDEILRINYLNIPIENSLLVLKGEIDNEQSKSTFNLSGNGLNTYLLKDLLAQSIFNASPLLNEIQSEGRLDLNLDVLTVKEKVPELKGKLSFHDVGFSIFQEEPLEVTDITGELLLDGSKVIFNKLSGLINNEEFAINGNFSLKEDETISLYANAKHLKIIPYLLSFITSKTPFKPVAQTISGDLSNLDLNISGSFSKPNLDGVLSINNASFNLPNLKDKIIDISGDLRFDKTDLIIEGLTGKVQNSDFEVIGYIEDLFSNPKPRLRLVTGDIELSNFWTYVKEQLKTTSLNAQAESLEKFKGVAALDIFLRPDLVLGNIYFKDAEIKYKLLPFGLSNLEGRLVIGEKNLSVFDLMGNVDNSNNFTCNLVVSNYLDPSFDIQGQLNLALDLPSAFKAINAPSLNQIVTDGIIPTIVNFNVAFPKSSFYFYSILDEMLMLTLDPYLDKPIGKDYTILGNIDFDTKAQSLYLNEVNIMSKKLSISTMGSIKNISSENPELMLNFASDEPCGIFRITEPITPFMNYKVYGMIEIEGSITGTPSNYLSISKATANNIAVPELLGKKLTATDGTLNIRLDNKMGTVETKINNVKYVSLNAKSILLSAKYSKPVFYLDELSVNGEGGGSIFALGSFDEQTKAVSFNANGTDFELSSLGAFVFLDPSKISGKTNFSFMIEGEGDTRSKILSTAKGDLSFSVTDGNLGQVALLQKGLLFANLFGQGIFGFNLRNVLSLFFKHQEGNFNSIKGDLTLNKGIIKAKEFNYRADDLFLNSFGIIDLVNSFISLSFYGYLPGSETKKNVSSTSTLLINPETIRKKRFIIPFISSTPLQYFKFEVKGDIKKPKKITRHSRRSFKWLKGKRLNKEFKFVPKP